jgi:eukaryotic-like serine/threonine-protein kinase
MGHVWLARDERSGLDVALKMVAREGKAAMRAEREAKAASALRHPRCQRIYALARDSSHVYIAYEYVPGRTLREALNTGEIGDGEAVEVAAQLAEALAHAHRRGIVHRDVKPSNVLLAESGGVDARLLDFGLAQMAEFDTLTAMGDVPGTLAYVSPERLLGREATDAADVWAVGVMLWEALARRHPFRAASMNETSSRIQSGAEPLERERPDLPPAVHRAVASALALNPARRPSAAELAEELRAPAKRRKPMKVATPTVRRPTPAATASALRDRALPGALAAILAGWVAATLPFYPAGWAVGVAAGVGTLAAASPRLGMLLALATAVLPLGNISLGLAVLYAIVICGWSWLMWKDARSALLFVAGPLLTPLAALGLVPLVAQLARGPVRRGAQAGAAVLAAAIVAGFGHTRLPFGAGLPPLGLGIADSTRPSAVAHALWSALVARPNLLAGAAVLAAAAVALPSCRRRGAWVAAGFGAALLTATALVAPATAFLPLAVTAWITAGILVLEQMRLGSTNYTEPPG